MERSSGSRGVGLVGGLTVHIGRSGGRFLEMYVTVLLACGATASPGVGGVGGVAGGKEAFDGGTVFLVEKLLNVGVRMGDSLECGSGFTAQLGERRHSGITL